MFIQSINRTTTPPSRWTWVGYGQGFPCLKRVSQNLKIPVFVQTDVWRCVCGHTQEFRRNCPPIVRSCRACEEASV